MRRRPRRALGAREAGDLERCAVLVPGRGRWGLDAVSFGARDVGVRRHLPNNDGAVFGDEGEANVYELYGARRLPPGSWIFWTTCYYAKMALGLGAGIDLNTALDYEAFVQSWAFRTDEQPIHHFDGVGFRVARTLPEQAPLVPATP